MVEWWKPSLHKSIWRDLQTRCHIWPAVTTSFKQQCRSLQLVDDVPLEQWRASALWSSCSKVWGWGGERQGKEGEGAGLPCGEEQGGCAACLELWVGVGDIIEKIVDSRYISIFSSYWQIIDIEKKIYLGIINFKKMCILFHPINSI